MKISSRLVCNVVLCTLLLSSFYGRAQDSSGAELVLITAPSYPFVQTSRNVISNAPVLDALFVKLRKLQSTRTGKVRVVHIGDSHIQADMMTAPIRRTLQAKFGNGGRGLVFPYSVAGSNPPDDVKSASNKKWEANRLAHPEKPIACGVAGFGIHNSSPQAYVDLRLAPDAAGTDYSFNKITLFGDIRDSDSMCYSVANDSSDTQEKWLLPTNKTGALVYALPKPVNSIRMAPCSPMGAGNFSLYGVALEKAEASGLLYNVIGVNGATFEQYNTTPLFWQGLPQLAADCYILSMGTNEAQAIALDKDSFLRTVRTMVEKLRAISPDASIIITTPAGSHRHSGTPNAVVGMVSQALAAFCTEANVACWDLYGATGGYRTAPIWKRYGLMAKDGIHYSRKGYEFQAALFLQALDGAYEKAKK